jgi:hypothetical protein
MPEPTGNQFGLARGSTRDQGVTVFLLAIDPGANAGWAVFEAGELADCGLAPLRLEGVNIIRVVIERPHKGKTPAPLESIIKLAIRAGELGATAQLLTGIKPEYIEPGRWKGSISKKISNERTMAKLTTPELKVFTSCCKEMALGKQHNVIDAIGIGLHVLRR